MKSLAELQAKKEQMQDIVRIRHGFGPVKVVVGMGDCGIAAGARPVLLALLDAVAAAGLSDTVTVCQSGCMGDCDLEPVVKVIEADITTIYTNMNAEKAARVVTEHLKGGSIVTDFTKA